jgi:hypothetical protein
VPLSALFWNSKHNKTPEVHTNRHIFPAQYLIK